MSYGNRGRAWEQLLELYHARYEARGQAVVLRTPPPMRILRGLAGGQFVAVYATEGPPDYVLLASGCAIAAEAKDCIAERWQLSKLHPHQARRLSAWQAQGGLGAVLLRHQPSSTQWVLPWSQLAPVWERWHEATEAGHELPRGSASLSLPQLHQLGAQFDAADGHLPVLMADLQKSTRCPLRV